MKINVLPFLNLLKKFILSDTWNKYCLIITAIFFWALISCLLSTNVAASSSVTLTSEEKAYIAAAPRITLASGISFDPFTVQNEDGTIGGIDADIAKLIHERTGLSIFFKRGKWHEMVRKAEKREYDGLSAAIRNAEREKFYNFSTPYIKLTPLVIVKKGNPLRIFNKENMIGKTVVLQKGNLLFQKIMAGSPGKVNFIYEDSFDGVIRSVVSGKADFTVLDETAFYIAGKLGLSTMIEGAFPFEEPFELVFALRKDEPLLQSIVNKGLKSITEQERATIRNRWLGSTPQNTPGMAGRILLTNQEKQFLATKSMIRVGIISTRMPYEGFTPDGKIQGMAANYLSFITKALGNSVKLYPISVKDPFQAIVNKNCDLAMAFESRPKEFPQIDYTSSFLSFPYVIATTDETLFIEDINQKADELFSIVQKDPAIEKLKTMYPKIKLELVPDEHQGLKAVSHGKTFGFIGSSAVVTYAIQKEFLADLKIAGELPFEIHLVLATHADTPTMNHITQKIVGLLQQEDRWQFISQWVGVRYRQEINYTLVWQIIGATLVILLFFIIWNRKLNAARKELEVVLVDLTTAQNKLEKKNRELEALSITDKLTGLYNRMKLDLTLQTEINRSKRYGSALSIIIMDIDHFKSINDQHGHQEGDEVLRQVASILKKNTRKVDFTGRWGGEEFLIICPETTQDQAFTLAEKMRTHLEQSDKNKYSITASFGTAAYQTGMKESEFINNADQALYKAKENGRNRVERTE